MWLFIFQMIKKDLQDVIEAVLGEKIQHISLKGKGYANNAYLVETVHSKKYVFKQERGDKLLDEQNSLFVEANIIQELAKFDLLIPLPHVVFVSNHPDIYGYEYIDGIMMIDAWPTLSENVKIEICNLLGRFHAVIARAVSKHTAKSIGLTIDYSTSLHPETAMQYSAILSSQDVPDEFKNLARKAMTIFEETKDNCFFQFIHNDAHHENILVKNDHIVGIIDFGDAEYGEIAKEFSRYIRDFPDYFIHIISSYEKESNHKLSHSRLITYSFLADLMDIVEAYRKNGEERVKATNKLNRYSDFIDVLC